METTIMGYMGYRHGYTGHPMLLGARMLLCSSAVTGTVSAGAWACSLGCLFSWNRIGPRVSTKLLEENFDTEFPEHGTEGYAGFLRSPEEPPSIYAHSYGTLQEHSQPTGSPEMRATQKSL